MIDLPGLGMGRVVRLIREAIHACDLDLNDRVVFTEAATGAYVVTPVMAAVAGAEVIAAAKDTRHGTTAEIVQSTVALADAFGVAERITIVEEKTEATVGRADIVTNSGHVRPLDRRMVGWLKPTAVVPLMFEAWEIQAGRFDVDLAALGERGIRVAGSNERHPAVDVFSYLGPMAVKLLHDAGIPVYGCRIVLLCDNPFWTYLAAGLGNMGAAVTETSRADELPHLTAPDVLMIAMRPTGSSVLDRETIRWLAAEWATTLVVQFWGDLDRDLAEETGLPCWPAIPPARGHMGVLPSAIGPDAIVRLQAGGLKVGAVLLKAPRDRTQQEIAFLDPL